MMAKKRGEIMFADALELFSQIKSIPSRANTFINKTSCVSDYPLDGIICIEVIVIIYQLSNFWEALKISRIYWIILVSIKMLNIFTIFRTLAY